MKNKGWIIFAVALICFWILEAYSNYKQIYHYCASIKYFNSNTGTQSVYYDQVDVQNNRVLGIRFGNGRYLGKKHFASDNLVVTGRVIIKSDEGYIYEVHLIMLGACSEDREEMDSLDEDSPSDKGEDNESQSE